MNKADSKMHVGSRSGRVRTGATARTTALALGGGLLLAFAGAPAQAEDWSALGREATRSRLSLERSGTRFAAQGWEHSADQHEPEAYRALLASPAVADGFLVYATRRNVIRALGEADGGRRWEIRAGKGVYASPAIGRGLTFVFASDEHLSAFALADGSLVWRKALGAVGQGSPVIAGESVYLGTGHPTPRIWRLEAATGRVVWEAGDGLLLQAVLAPLAVAEGRVLVPEVGGRVHSLDARSGAWQWTAEPGGEINLAGVLVSQGRVYLVPGGDKAELHALDLATGRALEGWPVTLPDPASSAGGTVVRRRHLASSPAYGQPELLVALRTDSRIDASGDGVADRIVLDERVLAIDPVQRRVLWVAANGRLAVTDQFSLPTQGFVPAPAVFRTIEGVAGGEVAVAVASSLQPRLRLLGLSSGNELWSSALSATTRSSPLFANGRLVVATDAGVVHSFPSRSNRAPLAPAPLALGAEQDAAAVALAWAAAEDADGGGLSYQLRLDDDGEVLRDWDLEVSDLTTPSHRLGALPPGRTYTAAVRARDAHGALSAWSLLGRFRSVASPAVSVEGRPADSLADALGQVRPGQVINLGPGTYALSSTLQLPPGAILRGAGPHLTTLRARDLAVGVRPGSGSQLQQLTVSGARVGVELADAQGVELRNLILRDNADVGLLVKASASGELVNATLTGNGVGLRAQGPSHLRNSLVFANRVGLEAAEAALLDGRFNDVYGNREDDYRNVRRAGSDLAAEVRFQGDGQELRPAAAQPSTDQGDPGDEFGLEPEPNGKRINIGAFGNTPFAELSVSPGLPPAPVPEGPVSPRPDPGGPGEVTPEPNARSGRVSGAGLCTLAGPTGAGVDAGLLLVALALLGIRRRPRR